MRTHWKWGALAALGLLLPNAAAASDKPDVSVGGKIYAEWGMDLSEGADKHNAFDLKRVYVTTKAKLTDGLSTKVTSDVGRDDHGKFELFLKNAYLEAGDLLPGAKLRFGMSGTAWTGFYDKLWKKRWIAKSFTDDRKLLSTADLGIQALGEAGDGMLSWQAGVINGEGYKKPEENKIKTGQLRLTVDPLSKGDDSLPIGVFVSQDLSGEDESVRLLAAGVGWKRKGLATVWGEYVMRDQHETSGAGLSATVVVAAGGLFEVFGRFDRWDPDTDADDDAEDVIRAGVSKELAKKVAAALLFERKKKEGEHDPSQGVFVKMLGGF